MIFPALEGSRGHALWRRDFSGACGLFGVILKPVAKARVDAMLDGLRLFSMGLSWGGFESLIIPAYPERIRTRHALGSAPGPTCGCTWASRTRRISSPISPPGSTVCAPERGEPRLVDDPQQLRARRRVAGEAPPWSPA